jgi:hypothetical protein
VAGRHVVGEVRVVHRVLVVLGRELALEHLLADVLFRDLRHMQITADLMHKFGLGKMVNPPKSDAEWVKLDLLE